MSSRPLLALLVLAAPFATAAEWDVRELQHPVMGPITAAVPADGFITRAGKAAVVSAAYVSCEKRSGRIAIELANALQSQASAGLKAAQPPRLACRDGGGELAATWQTTELGDSLARGFPASALRRCSAIEVTQSIALPSGLGAPTARVSFTIAPGDAGLAAVFRACGAEDAPRVAAAAPAPMPAASPAPPPVAPAVEPAPVAVAQARVPAEASWRAARTSSQGRTNVREQPRTDARAVAQLHPGQPLMVQKADADWWRVRMRNGPALGYIRADRLAFE